MYFEVLLEELQIKIVFSFSLSLPLPLPLSLPLSHTLARLSSDVKTNMHS